MPWRLDCRETVNRCGGDFEEKAVHAEFLDLDEARKRRKGWRREELAFHFQKGRLVGVHVHMECPDFGDVRGSEARLFDEVKHFPEGQPPVPKSIRVCPGEGIK